MSGSIAARDGIDGIVIHRVCARRSQPINAITPGIDIRNYPNNSHCKVKITGISRETRWYVSKCRNKTNMLCRHLHFLSQISVGQE